MEALREIVMLTGHGDPSDGEGTSPEEVVGMVRSHIADLSKLRKVRDGLNAGLKVAEHCNLNPTAYVNQIKEALTILDELGAGKEGS